MTNPYQSHAMQASSLLWGQFADEVAGSAAPNHKYHDVCCCFVLCVPFKRVHVSPRHSLRAGGVALMLMPARIWGCFDSRNGQRKKNTEKYKYINIFGLQPRKLMLSGHNELLRAYGNIFERIWIACKVNIGTRRGTTDLLESD